MEDVSVVMMWVFFSQLQTQRGEKMPYFHGVAQGKAPCAWQPQMGKEKSSSTALGSV